MVNLRKISFDGDKMESGIYRKNWRSTAHVKEKIWAFGCRMVVGIFLTLYNLKFVKISVIVTERRLWYSIRNEAKRHNYASINVKWRIE